MHLCWFYASAEKKMHSLHFLDKNNFPVNTGGRQPCRSNNKPKSNVFHKHTSIIKKKKKNVEG